MANCGCNDPYTNICRQDIPYPQTSHESVPSLIDNLVLALYGEVTKYVEGGRVLWNIPCDPSQSPAEVPSIPRNEGEGLLCYIMRVFQLTVGQYSPFQFWAFTGNGSTQTFSLPPSNNTLASSYLVYINGVVQSPSPSVYTISNTTPVNLVFQSAPANNAAITVVNLGYTPPSVIDVTQSAATPTGSSQTQTVGAWLQQILLALSTPSGGVPQGGLRWAAIGNGIQTTLPLTGAVSINPTAYLVAIDGVVQDPADYSINTSAMPYSLVLPQAIPNGSECVVVSINSPIAGWFTGSGSPNGVLAAPIGSIYVNQIGGQGNTFWVKEVGIGNTGWVALSSTPPSPSPAPLSGNKWQFTGNGATAIYNLTGATATQPQSYIVAIDGVLQNPFDYIINSASNPFQLILDQPVPNASKLVVVG